MLLAFFQTKKKGGVVFYKNYLPELSKKHRLLIDHKSIILSEFSKI